MQTNTTPEPPEIHLVALDRIVEGYADQQRLNRSAERIAELAQSIDRVGILTPLLLRPNGDSYETVAGGYRREAAKLAGLTHVPAILVDHDDSTAFAMSVTENLQRTNISPLEEAEIIRIAHVEHGQTVAQIAHTHGRTVNWVQDRLDLLTWDPLILEAVHNGELSKAAARPLASVDNPKLRAALLSQAIEYGATARITANWVRTAKLRADVAHPDDADAITNAPQPPSQRVLATCWMCRDELEIAHVSHLPTCPLCVEAVRRQGERAGRVLHADSPPTAASSSPTVTPA